MTRDEFNEAIILDTLRRFILNSDLSDRRISRLMGVEIETLRTWIAGTANPRKQSLNKIRSFLKWHGRKDNTVLPDLCDSPRYVWQHQQTDDAAHPRTLIECGSPSRTIPRRWPPDDGD